MKKKLMIIILLLLLVLLPGCWNRRELNELAISHAMGIEKTEAGEYRVTVQIINPSAIAMQEPGTGTYTPVVVYTETGTTMFEALRKLTMTVPRKIYESYTQVVVINEELAEEGIIEALDFLVRDHEFRTDFYFLIAKNARPSEVLEVLTVIDKLPANEMHQSLRASQSSWGATKTIEIDKLLTELAGKGVEATITGVVIEGDPDAGGRLEGLEESTLPALLSFRQMAVFSQDRLIGWLNEQESIGLNYAQDNIDSTIVNIACPTEEDSFIGVELIRSKAGITTEINNGIPSGTVTIKAEAQIGNVQCSLDTASGQSLAEIEKRTGEQIVTEVEQSIAKAQELRADVFGFGKELYQQQPKEWKEVESGWNERFATMEIQVNAEVTLIGTGNANQSVKKLMEEE
ncbi:Ger(x)C family spore germination protein [Alkalihalobacillus oceani]|uniref:Ger(x)C family spore germination protein n=1 Tax=Halalkalibacter oceani TaxID=1653776 RepID=UPI002040D545|nr:Ger(x)C family spore germination protein [Halalkalibacter oceani]MCM3761716.1 Ger(x)C family spore germination protein [Halalkalibacter oceani]